MPLVQLLVGQYQRQQPKQRLERLLQQWQRELEQ